MKEEQKIGEHIIDHLQTEKDTNVTDPVLQSWAESKPGNKRDLSKYMKIWQGINILAKRKKYDADTAWESVHYKITNQARVADRFKIVFLSGVAAALLILLGFSFYFNWFAPDTAPLTLTTEMGSRSEVVLPDGTSVMLNAGSELIYQFDRRKKTRNVQFSGEGYFEVEKDKAPFIVQTQEGLNLKVLGTKFSLSAYPDDALIKTTLTEGKVELNDGKSGELVLMAGQTGAFDKNSGRLYYSPDEPRHNLSWMEKKLYMDNMSLGNVAKILERWYDVQITFTEENMGEDIHYTGTLREKSVIDVFEALNEISKINYKINGENIIVSRKDKLPMDK